MCAYIRASSVGCPSTFFSSWGKTKSDNFLGWRRGNLISSFTCQFSQTLTFYARQVQEKRCLHAGPRRSGARNNLLRDRPSRLLVRSSSLHTSFCLSPPQLFLVPPLLFR